MAIKLSFMTWVCPDWDVQQIVGAAKQYRYHGIEFRTEANQRHGIEPEADATFIRDVRQMFADNGLEISAIATSCRFSSADATERGRMVERAKQHIDLAAQIGSANVRVFGGAIPKGVSMDDAKRYIADCLRQLGEYAQPLGVYVLLETHDAFSRSKDALETVRIADHQHVRILWDVQHPYTHGETMEEAFNNVRELVRHCHIHDVRKSDGGWELCLLGEGEIPHDFVVRRLHEINFDGHLSGEFINPRWEPHVILSQYSEVLHRYLDELTG